MIIQLALPILLLTANQDGPQRFVVRDNYVKKEIMVPVRDGVKLFTAVYTPKDETQKWPIIICRTPYGAGPYGEANYLGSLGPTDTFASEKYIFVYQDVRGRYMSEGTHIYSPPINPNKKTNKDVDESTDAYDTIDWLVKNIPNNSGKVGIWGISQPGFYASNALVDAHPALVCASPQAPVTDRFVGDDDHHNGAFFLAQRFGFMAGFGAPRPVPAQRYNAFSFNTGGDAYKYFLEMGPLENAQKVFNNQNLFWNQTMEHETYDEFWKPRGVPQHLKKIKPAVLVIGGLFDAEDLFGAWTTYKAIEGPSLRGKSLSGVNHVLMGPWSHGGWRGSGERMGAMDFGFPTSDMANKMQTQFFNYYLKGQGGAYMPEATVFNTGANVWRTYPRWPPGNTMKAIYAMTVNNGLTGRPPVGGAGAFKEWVSDPANPVPYIGYATPGMNPAYMVEDQRFAAGRHDVVVFQTEPLTEEVTMAGPIKANLVVSTTGTDSDWIVKVIDVYPADEPDNTKRNPPLKMAGYQMLIRAEIMRGKFRNSLERPEPFVPGKQTKFSFALQDVLHTFKKGHRIMVQVQSSWFPLTDRNPQKFVNIPKAKIEDFQKATQRIYVGPGGSSLEVGLLK